MTKFLFLLTILFIFISCGEETKDDKCKNVTCDTWESCDSNSGVCKPKANKCNNAGDCMDTQTCDSNHDCVENNPCKDVTCSGHGKCFLESGVAKCNCDDNFELSNQTECILSVCKGVTCSGHGKCTVFNKAAFCTCDNGYTRGDDKVSCTKESSCTQACDDSWQFCDESDHKCKASSGFCDDHIDCTGDGKMCDFTKHKCVLESEITCTPVCDSWEKCNPIKQVCEVKEGFCSKTEDCTSPETCNTTIHRCESNCIPTCSGKECGKDGCGGSCGTCVAGKTCSSNQICETENVTDCTEFGNECANNTNGKTECSDMLELQGCTYPECQVDGCYKTKCDGDLVKTCIEDDANKCLKFVVTDCSQENKTCVEDDGVIPSCSEVTCIPDCNGKVCGDNGCGEVCGTCALGESCSADQSTCEVGQTILVGDVIITEFMANPKEVSDAKGEWVELYNTSNNDIDLNSLKINNKDVVFVGSSIITSHAYLLVSKSATESKLENVDATATFILGNSGDKTIALDLNGLILDTITYNTSNVKDGKSWQLDPAVYDHELNDDADAWCVATSTISAANPDLGTPRMINLTCSMNK